MRNCFTDFTNKLPILPEGFTDKTPKYIVKMYQERYEKKLITGRVHETDERYVAHNKKTIIYKISA